MRCEIERSFGLVSATAQALHFHTRSGFLAAGIKPCSSSPSTPTFHASPPSILRPPQRRVLGCRGIPFATAIPSSVCVIPARSRELTHYRLEWHTPLPTPCADCSGPPIIPAIRPSLPRPRGHNPRWKTPNSCRRVRRYLRSNAQRPQGCAEIIPLLRVV